MMGAMGRRLVRGGLGVLGVGLALGAGELVFRHRDEDAFPHLRCYQADAELGVRLEPNRRERIRFGGAPPSTIRIGPEGLRGAGLPQPAAKREEVLVVGDSQAFGLGVEDDQTFSARLQAALGRTVIDAGVPTYGPPEYEAMIERWIQDRPIGVVVLTLTFQNDFFEEGRPNKERHETWDGWAVRKGDAPAHVLPFPGRSWLYRDSHLFYALRRASYSNRDPETATPDFDQPIDPRIASVSDFAKEGAALRAQVRAKRNEALQIDSALAAPQSSAVAPSAGAVFAEAGLYSDSDLPKYSQLMLARADPGDIVDVQPNGEVSPISLRATASIIAEGARQRKEFEASWQKRHAAEIEKAEHVTRDVRAQRAAFTFATSPLAARLLRIGKMLRTRGIGLVVLGIPMDVMLFEDAWKKYGVDAPPDVTPIQGLAEELEVALQHEGIPWVFPSAALREHGSGVFMPLEFHLTVLGHQVVADSLGPWIERVDAPLSAPEVKRATSVYCARCQETEGRFSIDVGGALHARSVWIEGRPDLPGVGYGYDETVLDLAPSEQVAMVGANELERFTARREDERWVVTAIRLPRFFEEPKWKPPAPAKSSIAEFMRVTGLDREPRYADRTCESTHLTDLPAHPKGVFPHWRDVLTFEKNARAWLTDHPDRLAAYRACQIGAEDPPCPDGSIAVGPRRICRALCSERAACAAGQSCVVFSGQRVCKSDATDPAYTPPAAPPVPQTMGHGESEF